MKGCLLICTFLFNHSVIIHVCMSCLYVDSDIHSLLATATYIDTRIHTYNRYMYKRKGSVWISPLGIIEIVSVVGVATRTEVSIIVLIVLLFLGPVRLSHGFQDFELVVVACTLALELPSIQVLFTPILL